MNSRLRTSLTVSGALAALAALAPAPAFAWAYETHRVVNQLALRSLPADFPAFVHTPENAERIAYLAGEPDRWRSSPDEWFLHSTVLDHQINLEKISEAGLDIASLSPFRFEFLAQFAAARAAHPERFAPIDPAKDRDRTQEWPGFLPWKMAEDYGKLKASFSIWKAYRELGTPEEAANAEANIVYEMGIMGHFVGDSSQPLHTTTKYNGWVGPNPNGYTTWKGFHAWIDGTGTGGGFIGRAGITLEDLAPRVTSAIPLDLKTRTDGRDPVFADMMDFIVAQYRKVEPLYQLEKEGKLKADGTPGSFDGKPFIEGQVLKGGELLGSIWLTAWRQAGPNFYLRADLLKRKAAQAQPKKE